MENWSFFSDYSIVFEAILAVISIILIQVKVMEIKFEKMRLII